QGGRFGNGFITAGAGAVLAPIPEAASSNPGMQTVMAAVVGGTISELSGGKFANGAITGAFQFAVGRGLANGRTSSDQRLDDALDNYGKSDSDYALAYEDTSAITKWSGAAAGADAAQYWADLQVQTGNPLYA